MYRARLTSTSALVPSKAQTVSERGSLTERQCAIFAPWSAVVGRKGISLIRPRSDVAVLMDVFLQINTDQCEKLTMPLHNREAVRPRLDDSVFVDHAMNSPVPKYRFPRQETLPRDAYQLVADELMLDGNARQNLARFCQTWAEPEVYALMALAMSKNLIDADEYPQTAELERRCVHMLADLWHAPEAGNTAGCSAIGVSAGPSGGTGRSSPRT